MSEFCVWIEGDESSKETVKAFDASDAAEKFVKKYESGAAEHLVADGYSTVDVVVVDGDDNEAIYCVSGEVMPVYTARLA